MKYTVYFGIVYLSWWGRIIKRFIPCLQREIEIDEQPLYLMTKIAKLIDSLEKMK